MTQLRLEILAALSDGLYRSVGGICDELYPHCVARRRARRELHKECKAMVAEGLLQACGGGGNEAWMVMVREVQ